VFGLNPGHRLNPCVMALRHALLATAIFATLSQAQPEELQEEPEGHTDVVEQDMISHEQLVKAHSLIDTNNDGKVSMKELTDFSYKTRLLSSAKDIATIFEEMDENKDGKLGFNEIQLSDDPEHSDAEEKKQIEEGNMREKAKFEAADIDKDGTLSKEETAGLFYPEMNEHVAKLIAEHSLNEKDTDKDGSLSPKEFWGGGDEDVPEQDMNEFKSLDTDADNKLSMLELVPWESGTHHTKMALSSMISTLDKNSDGHITSDELTGARESLTGTDAGYHFLEWAEHHEL